MNALHGTDMYGDIRVVCNIKKRKLDVSSTNLTIVIGKTEIEVSYSKSINLDQVKSILWLLIM